MFSKTNHSSYVIIFLLIIQKTRLTCCNARHFNYNWQKKLTFYSCILEISFQKISLYLFVVYVQYYRFFQANKNTINLSLIFSAGKRGSFIKIFLAVVWYRSVSSEQLTMSCTWETFLLQIWVITCQKLLFYLHLYHKKYPQKSSILFNDLSH